MKFKTKAELSLIYVPTGRMSIGDMELKKYQQWIKDFDNSGLVDNFFLNNIIPELLSAEIANGVREYYRGVLSEIELSTELMGPCPLHLLGNGNRYNLGQMAWYLCDNEEGVKREIKWINGRKICMIKCRIDFSVLKVADFSGLSNRWINELMFTCELCDSELYPKINFSQKIGSYLREHYDGIIVRGVRGDPDLQYTNLIFFNRLDDYKKFIVTNPYLM